MKSCCSCPSPESQKKSILLYFLRDFTERLEETHSPHQNDPLQSFISFLLPPGLNKSCWNTFCIFISPKTAFLNEPFSFPPISREPSWTTIPVCPCLLHKIGQGEGTSQHPRGGRWRMPATEDAINANKEVSLQLPGNLGLRP